jgi:hypothetical protein
MHIWIVFSREFEVGRGVRMACISIALITTPILRASAQAGARDWRAWAFAVGAVLVCAITGIVVPATRAARISPATALTTR